MLEGGNVQTQHKKALAETGTVDLLAVTVVTTTPPHRAMDSSCTEITPYNNKYVIVR